MSEIDKHELRRRLVARLRDPSAKQVAGALEKVAGDGTVIGRCCLGEACRIFDEAFPGKLNTTDVDRFGRRIFRDASAHGVVEKSAPEEWAAAGDNHYGSLPLIVMQAFGFRSMIGTYATAAERDGYSSLAEKNDCGLDFAAIAALIESAPAELFDE